MVCSTQSPAFLDPPRICRTKDALSATDPEQTLHLHPITVRDLNAYEGLSDAPTSAFFELLMLWGQGHLSWRSWASTHSVLSLPQPCLTAWLSISEFSVSFAPLQTRTLKLHLGPHSFFFFLIYLFLIVLGLCCLCTGFSLVATSGACSLVGMNRLLIAEASLVMK